MRDSVLHTISRYSTTEIPDFFHREDWVAAVLFLLFLLIVIAQLSSRNLIVGSFTDLMKHPGKKDSTIKNTFADYLSRNLLILISISVFSLIICTGLTQQPSVEFDQYFRIWAATLGFVLLKYISMRLVGYIFLGQEKTRVGINTYFSILSVAGLLLYPVIGLKIYFLNGAHSSVFDTISLIISTLIILLIAVKIFQIFYHKMLDIFYIMLYLCTLEFIPLTIMFQVYNLFIRDFNF